MKGVVLAGGLGTRLSPLTAVLNKHLLPVYDRPVIFYPIECLARSGIDEVLVLTGGHNTELFPRLLGDGQAFELKRLEYVEQEFAAGVAYALGLAEDFAEKEPIVLMLGDNILQYTIGAHIDAYLQRGQGAHILLSEVQNPQSYGIAEFDDGQLMRIVEKPETPPSNMAVVGAYLYDNQVFDIIRELEPSPRGESEITNVNNAYLQRGQLEFSTLPGWWMDCGEDYDQYLACCNRVAAEGANHEYALGG